MIEEFRVEDISRNSTLVTQMLWGDTTHIGCGWAQFDVGEGKFAGVYPGRYENFFVCNYGVGGNVPGQPVYPFPDCEEELEGESVVGVFKFAVRSNGHFKKKPRIFGNCPTVVPTKQLSTFYCFIS